jgi:F-type H+-transporting ATPase subunit gamma
MRPYARKLQEMLSNIVSGVSGDMELPLAQERAPENILLIPITSDRGTCGAYNSNIIKLTRHTIEERYAQQAKNGKVSVLPIGKKGFEYFGKHSNYKVVTDFQNIFTNLTFDNIKRVAQYAQESFLNKEYDRIEIVYSQFKNAATQEFVVEAYLPIPKVEENKDEKQQNNDFIFEPSKETLLEELMPKILNTQVYKAILDAHASEHGARMTAMDKATENANELLHNLKISYNRARQAAITTELTEIVSGAAALEGA